MAKPRKPRSKAKQKPERRPKSLAAYVKWFASRGGTARAKRLTAEERRAIARRAARGRWGKRRKRET